MLPRFHASDCLNSSFTWNNSHFNQAKRTQNVWESEPATEGRGPSAAPFARSPKGSPYYQKVGGAWRKERARWRQKRRKMKRKEREKHLPTAKTSKQVHFVLSFMPDRGAEIDASCGGGAETHYKINNHIKSRGRCLDYDLFLSYATWIKLHKN